MTDEKDLDTKIRERAYAIWEAEGKPHDKHEEHWLRAREEITGTAQPTPRRKATSEKGPQGSTTAAASRSKAKSGNSKTTPTKPRASAGAKPSKGRAKP